MPDTADNLTHCKPAPLFKPEMREQIRLGNKTQTRRPLNPQPPDRMKWWSKYRHAPSNRSGVVFRDREQLGDGCGIMPAIFPHQTGDILYLREPLKAGIVQDTITYADDGETVMDSGQYPQWQWKRNTLPSIHMPKRFARTFLRVTDVRVERIQDISEEDALAEGAITAQKASIPGFRGYWKDGSENIYTGTEGRYEFARLWDRIHGDGAFERNDWVWAYTFELTDNPNRKERT